MPNVESLEQHNVNYVKDDAFEREKKAHLEHNSNDFKSVSYTHLRAHET